MRTSRRSAFTASELLIVIVSLVVGALALALWLPSRARAVTRGGLSCLGNQRQVALAFRTWANDNGEAFPMHVPESKGGSRESIARGAIVPTYLVISNDLRNPKALVCPSDSGRKRTNQFAGLSRNSISYFVGMDLTPTNSSRILIGDRNLCVNGQPADRSVEITNAGTVTWGPGIHVRCGNVALVDGSAHQVTDMPLQKALQDSGVPTNRFVIP